MKDITGNKYGKLTVMKRLGKNKENRFKWLCKCECGGVKETYKNQLDSGAAKHCGCDANRTPNLSHGMRKHPLYSIWSSMIDRCSNPKNENYHNYGGRGISVSKEWMDVSIFIRDMSPRPDKFSLDRIDNEKGYSKENCRWATMAQQGRNKRDTIFIEYNGVNKPLIEWAEEKGVKRDTMYMRYRRGYTNEEIINGK